MKPRVVTKQNTNYRYSLLQGSRDKFADGAVGNASTGNAAPGGGVQVLETRANALELPPILRVARLSSE